MKSVDKNYFPGWTRKAVSYSIDDGNVPLDIKFLDIVKPAGFKGTFNLCNASREGYTPEDYRRIYDGCEIANHCKNHPLAIPDGAEWEISDEMYDHETAEENVLYRSETPGLLVRKVPGVSGNRRKYADAGNYIRFIHEAQEELEAVFGENSVGAFVWPYGEQNNAEIKAHLKDVGFYGVRKTGRLEDKGGFALPTDRSAWIYNAGYDNFEDVAEKFESYPDDGQLKLFVFGIHSHDYENNGKWGNLAQFADRYGNRPEDFWYATNREVFEYEDAVNSVEITENSVYNPTSVTLYIKVDGKRVTLAPMSRVAL